MWSAIRSDLTEFVSSVADDGNAVMTNIESKIIPEIDADGDYDSDEEQVMIGDDGDVVTRMNFERTGIVSNAQDEVCRREGLEETYTRPLLKGETNGVKLTPTAEIADNKTATDEKGEKNDVTEERDPDEKELEKNSDEGEVENKTVPAVGQTIDRMALTESEEEPALSDGDCESNQEKVLAFLETFDLSSKTDTISTILAENSTVQEYFQTLVPVVLTYEQFWQRYFYRCNVMRIQVEWDEAEAQKTFERRERVKKGVENVQKLWGGALNAVKGVTSNVTKPESKGTILSKYQAELEQLGAQVGTRSVDSKEERTDDGGGMKLGLGIFGGPRYASESENEEGNNDHEDDEEEYEDDEFGWGSEEEDDDEDNDDDDDVSLDDSLNESEEITFTSPPNITQEELDELHKSLKQFQEDKEKLQEKIDIQAAELNQLKEVKTSSGDSSRDKEEEEQLQLLIFERDAEIAALKASLNDSIQDDDEEETNKKDEIILSMTNEIELLNSLLKTKEVELKRVNQDLSNVVSAREESLRNNQDKQEMALGQAQEMVSKLQIELTQANATSSKCLDEVQEWKKQVSLLKEKVSSEASARVSLEARLVEVNGLLQGNETKQDQLKTDIQKLKAALQDKDEELTQQKLLITEFDKMSQKQQILPPTFAEDVEDDSFSSGVDVVPPESKEDSTKQIQVDNENGDEEDGWGDSWDSDED